jgi:hypothetical protein
VPSEQIIPHYFFTGLEREQLDEDADCFAGWTWEHVELLLWNGG